MAEPVDERELVVSGEEPKYDKLKAKESGIHIVESTLSLEESETSQLLKPGLPGIKYTASVITTN